YVGPDTVSYLKKANENTTVICQIESPIGVANADAIAATPGVDVLWIGHSDLSSALGIPAEFHHPRFLDALKTTLDAANRHGKAAAIQPGDAEQAEEWIAMGFHIISWKTDIAIYRATLANEIAWVRERVARR